MNCSYPRYHKPFIILFMLMMNLIPAWVYAGISVSTTDASSCNKADGKATITVTASGGNFDFEYAVDGGAFQTSNRFENLSTGNHVAQVRDKRSSCKFTKNFTIKAPNEMQVSVSGFGTNEFCNNTSPPSVTLRATASGGSGNYEYSWPGGTKTVTAGGYYSVTVTDKGTRCTKTMGGRVIFIPIVCSQDPNDIVGPEGYGPGKMISKFEVQPYMVRFENDPKFATAPAQLVKISHPLDENVNLFSFRLGNFGFGRFTFRVPENKTFYSARLDVMDSLGVVVDVTAGIDVTKKEAFWIFESKDPRTGLPPTNAVLGFLPVNDSTAIGEGFVSYTIKAANHTATGDTIHAKASIVFDVNAAIETPEVWNTVDAAAPSSTVQPLVPGDNTSSVTVHWTGQDDAGGAGVRSYALYASEDNGPFGVYKSGITETSTQFTGKFGSSYRFFTRAVDNVGNQEAMKQQSESSVTLTGRSLVIGGFTDRAVCGSTGTGPIAFTVRDGSNPAAGVSIRVSSSNPALVSGDDVLLQETTEGRTLTVTPAAGQTGSATLTVKAVTADGGSGETTFVLTVRPVPQLLVTNPPAVCAPGTVDLAGTFSDPANVAGTVTYWRDSLATVPLDAPHTVAESGTYYLKKTAGEGGCASIKPVAVTVHPRVVVEAGAARTVLADTTEFYLTGFSPLGGTWSGTGVDADGRFTPMLAGVGTFTLAYTVDRNGCMGSDSVTVTVMPARPAIAGFSPLSGYVGTLVSLTGTNFTGAAAVQFGGVNATAFTVVADTLITATVPDGAATGPVSVVTPSGAIASADDFTVRVRTTPVIAWATPLPVTFGTALSGDQLNATADVAGTFAYAPAAGTVLDAGEHPLTVTFTPDNQTDYTTVSRSVTLTVEKATPVVTWPNPAPVAEGTVLSGSQLNAAADVAGAFAYTPAAGTVLTAGRRTLTAEFTPADARNYRAVPGTTVQLVVNGAPVLAAIGNRTVNAGDTLRFTATATDADGLGQTLSYALAGDAYGATLDAATGAFGWTTTTAQGGNNYQFTVRVTDDGTPALAAEETITVTVRSLAPRITAFTPASGPVGTRVTLTGSNLAGVTVVRFNGVTATVLSATDTQLVTTVPAGATTGPIAVSGPAGLAITATPFTVTVPQPPTISDFTPSKGPVGTQVTLNGTNFTGATAVRFGTVAAITFRVVSAGTITATVPAGAVTAFLYVTTPGGTAVSKKQFQVTTPRARVAGAGKPAPEAFAVEYNPNPFAREFTLTVKGKPGENAAVVIYDAFGRVARKVSELPLNKKLTLGLDLPPAVYYLHVTHDNEVRVFKIVKLGL